MEFDHELLMQAFLEETAESLQALEESLVLLEGRPDDTETLHRIFRAAHTIKGSAGILGFQQLGEVAHRMEDLLDRLRSHAFSATPSIISLLLAAVDVIRRVIAESTRPEGLSAATKTLAERMVAKLGQAIENPPRAASRKAKGRTVQRQPSPPAEALAPGKGFDAPDAPTLGSVDAAAPSSLPSLAERPESEADGESESLDGDASELPAIEDEASPAAATEGWTSSSRTLRVDIDRLDRMLNLTGEIAISRGRLRQMFEETLGRAGEDLLEAHRELDRLSLELQELVMKIRMVPIGPVFRQHVRTVRDVASQLGKNARLVIEGGDVEVDMTVVEHLRDPLMHMIRNAIGHGIESPAERIAVGKEPSGTLTLRAFHEAGSIVMELEDDGAGFRRDRIVARARELGLAAEPEKLGEQELFRLVFEPGFSTADQVTSVSGRGVGMDVVQRNVENLRGSISLESTEGRGSIVRIRLPLTLAIIEGFGVGVADDTYIVPVDAVVECLELPADPFRSSGRGFINLRGEPLPYVCLRDLFGTGGSPPHREHVVVVEHGGIRAGLAVDNLYGERQTVIKPLGRLFQGIPGIAGSAILGNGRVALILDVRTIVNEETRARRSSVEVEAASAEAKRT